MNCSACGKEVRSGSIYCHHCGAKLGTPLVNKDSQRTCFAFYLFNSNIISDRGNSDYGGYAEKNLLWNLFYALQPDGGWRQYHMLTACHGDITDSDYAPTIRVLKSWIQNNNYGIDYSNITPSLLQIIRSGKQMEYWPYAVGIGPLQERHVLETHRGLAASSIDGYDGVFNLFNAPSLSLVASQLLLPCGIELRGGTCKGLFLSKDDLAKAGLEGLEPRYRL